MGLRRGETRSAWLGRGVRGLGAAALVGLLACVLAAPARAEEARPEGENYGLGLVAGVGSLVYFPAKLVYSTVGGVVGGMTYLVTLGDTDTANAVWQPTLGGSYVLTPAMVAGEKPVDFVGPQPAPAEKTKLAKGQWPE